MGKLIAGKCSTGTPEQSLLRSEDGENLISASLLFLVLLCYKRLCLYLSWSMILKWKKDYWYLTVLALYLPHTVHVVLAIVVALSEINHKSKSHFQSFKSVFCYLPWKIGDWADLEIVACAYRYIPAECCNWCKLFYLYLNLYGQLWGLFKCTSLYWWHRGAFVYLRACSVALWLSFAPVFSSLLGVEPIPSFSRAPRHSSFPYQCQAVRGGGSRRQPLCRSAQPCVCNHSGCCSADWCCYVRPCCRWLISHSVGYNSAFDQLPH